MAAENQYGSAIGSGRRLKQNGGVCKNIKVDLISTPVEKPRRLDFLIDLLQKENPIGKLCFDFFPQDPLCRSIDDHQSDFDDRSVR